MNSYRYGSKGAAIAAATMLLALAAVPARAQAPGGSYLQTCTHVRGGGDRVIADCRRVDGSWNRTMLRDADSCVGGIANMNGNLTCNHARREFGEMRNHRGWDRSDRWDQGYGSSERHYERNYYGR